MDWQNWQTYVAPAIVLLTIGIFLRRWIKSKIADYDANCCNGGCGCSSSKRNKKREADALSRITGKQ